MAKAGSIKCELLFRIDDNEPTVIGEVQMPVTFSGDLVNKDGGITAQMSVDTTDLVDWLGRLKQVRPANS